MITSHVSEPTSVDSSLTHRFKRHPHTGQRSTAWMSLFLFLSTIKWKIYGSVETHGGRDSTKSVFSAQTFAMTDANVCRGGCNALRLRRAKLAPKSPVLFWIREYLRPSLHVLATFLARTCDLPCTYLREKSCWRGICELDFCNPSIIASHSTNLLGGHPPVVSSG